MTSGQSGAAWPDLPYREWRATRDTLHMYTQVIGKLRLALSAFEPQWGHVALYVTARGLTTSPIPFGRRAFEAELDLIDHALVVRTSDGQLDRRPLGGSVADFYGDVMAMLARMRLDVKISVRPSEVPDPIPFPDDRTHDVYDAAQANQFFRALSRVDMVLKEHRGAFHGRTSPVNFFWGTFDLALSRSGRRAEPPAGSGVIRRLGVDAEQVNAGWWPGDERVPQPSFFAYAWPKPEGIESAGIEPSGAAWNEVAGEFFYPYDEARSQPEPRQALLTFLSSTYTAGSTLMNWDPGLVDGVLPESPSPAV